ncbi:unnamed protein product [Brassicogethes aeneus]|uniref:Uncharacterized protein n=1 Tax=Brassicogethes aeneus TaxID=1431903 RepID=A0A9P0FJF2_BRAAE|nr:unnamed protein product [Brassicogethes aeneus]
MENPTQLFLNNDNVLSGSYINFTNPTKMYVPGFLGSYQNSDSQDVKNAYLYTQDCNMILVDSSQLLPFLKRNIGLSYDAQPIGVILAEFIDYLITKGLKLTDLELIGISLGGQAIGIAGAAIKTGKPAKIIVFCSHSYSYHVGVYAVYHPNAFPALNCTSYDEYANGLCNNNDLQYVGDQVTASAQGNYYAKAGNEVYNP